MFNRILVAVDLAQPELADRALRQVVELVKAFSAEVPAGRTSGRS